MQEIIDAIRIHHNENPTHGINCACMDKLIKNVRRMIHFETTDSRLQRRIDYVIRAAVEGW